MRSSVLAFILLTLVTPALGAETSLNLELVANARALDARSRDSLGVGIRHLSLLLQASPNGFFRKETLEHEGSWSLLKDLEAKGFITIAESSQLPDGQRMGNAVVSFSATPKGQAIIAAIKGE